MPATATLPEISEVIAVLHEITDSVAKMDRRLSSRLDAFEGDLRGMREKGAKPPLALGAPSNGAPAHPLLSTDNKFSSWLRSPRGQKSNFATSFEGFHIEQKVSPLLNTGGTMHLAGIAGPPPMALRLVELFNAIPMSAGGSAEYGRETAFTPGAAIVPEGTVKPVTSIDYANTLATVKTIATVTKCSVQGLADTPELGQWLDARLRYAVQLKAEDVLLNAAAPDGLLASAGTIDPAFAPTAGTPLDDIGAGISQLQAAGYTVDAVVMNGSDVSKMRLLKDGNQNYVWATPDSALGTSSVWSVPLVVSPSMPAGQWLVGAIRQSCLLFVRQLLTVEIAYENEDDFIRNLACLRAEERIASAVAVPGGLLKGTFVALPLAQAAPQNHAKK